MDIYVNHIYGGAEGYYSVTGSASKMSPAYEQYRWRVLEDGVVNRLHAVCWLIAEDESLIAYKSSPAANRDTYIVGGVDARYIQYQSSTVTVSEYGAGKLLVCYGDSITDGSVTNIGYPFYVPRVSEYGTINLGSSGGTAERIRHIATGEGDGGGTYTDISKYVNGGFVAGIVLMSGLNNTTAPTATNALTIEWLMARYPQTRIILAKYHYVSNPGTGKTTTAQMLRCDESVDELAERYELDVWSPRDCWGADNADQYLADGVHPNNTGAELIARSLASYLAANTEEPGEPYYEAYRRSGERVMIPATRVLYNRYGQTIEPIVPETPEPPDPPVVYVDQVRRTFAQTAVIPAGAERARVQSVGGHSFVEDGAVRHTAVESVTYSGTGVSPATQPIPSAVLDLPGYGWGVGSESNTVYRDGERWKFRKPIRKDVVNASGSWVQFTNANGIYYYAQTSFTGALATAFSENAISDVLTPAVFGYARAESYNGTVSSMSNGISVAIVPPTEMSSVADFKAWIADNPITIYYVSTDVEGIDITDLMGDSLPELELVPGMTNVSFVSETGAAVTAEVRYRFVDEGQEIPPYVDETVAAALMSLMADEDQEARDGQKGEMNNGNGD